MQFVRVSFAHGFLRRRRLLFALFSFMEKE